jgi:uncharacterized membrane protein
MWLEAYQNVVLSTTILTVPGNLDCFVNASSTSMGSCGSVMLSSEIASSVSASRNHGGDPAEERNIPAAAACVSVGELRAAVVFDGPRELRAMRMWDGLVAIRVLLVGWSRWSWLICSNHLLLRVARGLCGADRPDSSEGSSRPVAKVELGWTVLEQAVSQKHCQLTVH